MAQQPSEKLDFSRQFGRPDKHDIWVRHITMVEKIISPPRAKRFIMKRSK